MKNPEPGKKREFFKSWDGTELFYRKWHVNKKNNKALIVLHRGHEHSGRLSDLVEKLHIDGFSSFGYDARGHGYSPGARGYAEDFSYLVKDLDTFVNYISGKYKIPVENMVVVANSVGAVISSTWVHDYAPPIRGMILAAPAFRIKLYVPFALAGLRLLNKIKNKSFITSYVKSKMLTHDKEQAKLYDDDQLVTKDIATNVLLGLHDSSTRIVDDAGAIVIPTLILSAGSDWVVKLKAQKQFFQNLSSKNKKMIIYPKFYHGVFFEKDRHLPIKESIKFINNLFKKSYESFSLLSADKSGYTRDEYDKLKSPSIVKSFGYTFQKILMKSLGRLSKGIRIGLASGFDSGLSLDHIYKNRAEGFTPIGKFIDYNYINAIGWKGIRLRKKNVQATLDETIKKLIKEGKPVRIMDIAAGPGRYLVEIAKKYDRYDLQVLLRDHDIKNLNEGRAIAEKLDCKNVIFKLGDAFDKNSYNKKEFKPNIIVISGFYELFPGNSKVLNSIAGAASMIDKSGYIIYTGQPWHPQIEMISNTLRNRDGDMWVMRRRTQAELDEIIGTVGFKKIDMKIDPWGIFTVSTAVRKNSR